MSISILTTLSIVCYGQTLDQKFLDNRDKKTYDQIKIGEAVWMGEDLNYNLNYSYFYYQSGDATFYNKYNVSSDTICPPGWRIPNLKEFKSAFEGGLFSKFNTTIYHKDKFIFLDGMQKFNQPNGLVFWANVSSDSVDTLTLNSGIKPIIIVNEGTEIRIDLLEGNQSVLANCRCIR